ncbi:hypothetical protein H257_10122 [Aphanomyces astaci]|uniref:Uncharacterized protein n=1 Tax=Aphanomyces astaci TaxID=112090 RepID=W4G9W8_APHAT|nr:hypothetical protein H257_10122 [Aphanomyces astaci]ETV75748.1 hypothetical protein H257_10122 [Aphanomyces astaci]|eukprot:XP_009834879.1 hypothetical protein H257_10122 [Aphanomyces astaci]
MESIEQKLWLRRYKRFDPFYEALLRSPPSMLAMATGKISIGSPTFPLTKAYITSATAEVPPTSDNVPRTVDALLGLQQPDGRWKLDAAFLHTMHHLVPPCPSGVGAAMWATACAVAALRRQHEEFDKLEHPCERGLTQVDSQAPPSEDASDDDLAPNNMPSTSLISTKKRRSIFELDVASAQMVRQLDHASATAVAHGLQREFSPKIDTSKRPFQVGDTVECCWRRPLPSSNTPARLDTWHPARIAHVYTDNVHGMADVVYQDKRKEKQRRVPKNCIRRPNSVAPSRSQVLGDLHKRWVLEPLPLNAELDRLAEIMSHDTVYLPAWRDVTAQAAPTSPHHAANHPLHLRTSSSLNQIRASSSPVKSPVPLSPAAQVHAVDSASSMTSMPLPHDAVIEAILAYEKYIAKLPKVLRPCRHLYKTARLFGDRIHAFDAWMPVAIELVAATATVVELVYALEQSIQAAPMTTDGPIRPVFTPFLWLGRSFLTSVANALNALGDCAELQDWYGRDFHFKMNPFLVTVPLHLKTHAIQCAVTPNTWWPELHFPPALRHRVERG